jgi:hypothetical protein
VTGRNRNLPLSKIKKIIESTVNPGTISLSPEGWVMWLSNQIENAPGKSSNV